MWRTFSSNKNLQIVFSRLSEFVSLPGPCVSPCAYVPTVHRVDFPQSQREYNPLFFLIYATETRVARHGNASYFPLALFIWHEMTRHALGTVAILEKLKLTYESNSNL